MFFFVNSGDRTHDPKTYSLSTTPFVTVVCGVLVRLTICKRLTNGFPELGLITLDFEVEESHLS